MSSFKVFIEHAEEGGYVVSCPSLPGCVSEGETRDEAMENIKDAITGYLTVLKRNGLSIPTVEVARVEVTL